MAYTLLKLYLTSSEEHLPLAHHNATHSSWQAVGLQYILVRKTSEKERQGWVWFLELTANTEIRGIIFFLFPVGLMAHCKEQRENTGSS